MLWPNLRADFQRFRGLESAPLVYVLLDQGLWAVAVYRFGRWVRGVKIPVISHLLKILAFILFKMCECVTGISLPASAQVGKGFYIGHFGGIFIHTNVQIGENCSVGPGVLLGTRGLGNKGVPVLGDGVYVGAGAKILGGVKIGNNARIGANTVVLCDVPDGATAVGIPARILTRD